MPMFLSKGARLVIHVAGWILFLGLVIAFLSTSGNGSSVSQRIITLSFFVFFIVYFFLFYFNSLVLFPKLYLQKQHAYYFVIIALLFAGIWFLKPFDDLMNMRPHFGNRHLPRPPMPGDFHPPPGPRFGQKIDIVSIVLFLMIWTLSSALELIKQWQNTEQRAAQAEADKTNAELSFLKAQINPHFLFNTLNNIYSLSVSNNSHTPEAILKLSNIMRYVTDEASQHFVPLQSEVDGARNYIDLQRLRVNDKATINFSVSGNLDGKQVAPLLLMSFIENAFKYGISNHEPFVIDMKVSVEKETIVFFCQNTIFKNEQEAERNGIGIANTKKRLEHLYPYKHLLSITSQGNLYTVQLTLQV